MSESFSYENLVILGQKKAVTIPVDVAIGQTWSRGTLVGLKTSTGLWELVDFDGVNDYSLFGIATEAVDSREGATVSEIFVEGEFNERAVIYGYNDDQDDWRVTLYAQGIYLRKSVKTTGEE